MAYTWTIPTGNIITGSTYIKDTDNKIQDTMDDLADFVNSSGAYAGQGLMFDYINKADNQTITGVKTFSNGLIGNVTGNSGTATKLATARKINGVYFDGSSDINTFQTGMIMLWSGSSNSIPNAWYLCNGNNGTPNLMDRFIVGAGSAYAVGATGGSSNAVIVSHTHTASTDLQGSHIHSAWTDNQGAHNHYVDAGGTTYVGGFQGTGSGTAQGIQYTNHAGSHAHSVGIGYAGSHGHNIVVSTNGESGTNKNLPPYYALCYIMKG